ncbi:MULTISPECIES: hypothetical protein [Acinetobacter]|uniref:O-antigen ligase domain-containing protein n=1 Tax=Acinetobacter piscicola TaxID=2006115 RepID=A0A7S7AFW8_9GAMM|nr:MULTISPECIES: hypothetical protein [Acinetobacter]QOW44512.1 hypothetical protein G0028_00505 [Acinetobacter piscicola]
MFNFIFFIFLFIFVVNLKTVFFSFPIFYFFAPIGLFLFLKDFYVSKFLLDRKFLTFFFIIFLSLIISAISLLVNQIGDFFYVRQIYLYSIISFFYIFFIIKIFLINQNNDFDKLVLFFITSVATQLFFSFVLFMSPSLFDAFFSIFDTAIGYADSDAVDKFNEQRMIAIGNPFFGSAIINCFTLVLLAVHFKFSKYKKILIVLWVVIAILGIASARTTIFGITLSLIILLKDYKSSYRYLLAVLIILLISLNFAYFTNERIQTIIDFSFSFIFDFKNSQASDSASELVSMWNILPSKVSTWLVGDNFFIDQNGYYYKGIDVGYTRIIFANGMLGLITFLSMQVYLLYNIKFKRLVLSLIALLLVILFLNFKGLANLTFLILIFFMYSRLTSTDYGDVSKL